MQDNASLLIILLVPTQFNSYALGHAVVKGHEIA